jgi:hypothetical protein
VKETTLARLRELWDSSDSPAAGKEIFEHISNDRRPGWAADIVEWWCQGREPLQELQNVIAIARDPQRWQLAALLRVAEIAAKITYNATGLLAPFDHHAGWRVAPYLRDFAAAQADPVRAKRQAWDLRVGPLRR